MDFNAASFFACNIFRPHKLLCMRVFFIGGTGNISAECAALLHAQGHEITILSRGSNPMPSQYRALVGDRKDAPWMRAALADSKPDVVINFIGYELADVQLDATLFDGRVRQYIFISSTTVHARPPAKLPITEDSAIGNVWWEYARKKAQCEEYLLDRWRGEKFPVTIVRPSHTYSKRWIPNAISSSSYTFADRLERGLPVFVHDDGQIPWTLTAASDFAAGLAGLIGREDSLGEAIHITSDEVLTWDQIYREIADALDVTDPLIHKIPTDLICEAAPNLTGTLKGDKAHPGIFDNSKLKRFVPDFVCRKPFRTGIRESVEWLRADPSRKKIDDTVNATIEKVFSAWRGEPFPDRDTL
jgi:nucleoside-diphosphate-sugar epimerase